jgi:hypothetical protein
MKTSMSVAAYKTVTNPARLTFENKNLSECKGERVIIPLPKWTRPWEILTIKS